MEEPRRDEGCWPAEAGQHDEEAAKPARRRRRSYSAADKAEHVTAYTRRRQSVADFCRERDLTEGNFRRWLKEAGVAPQRSPKRAKRKARRRRRHFTPEEKRAAVEAFEQSELSQADFCLTWGLSVPSLRSWLRVYRAEGPQGLEPKPRKKAEPGDPRKLPDAIRAEIVSTKEENPSFGARKVRDELFRFRGMKVSATTVAKVLEEAGLPTGPRVPLRRRRRASPPRRFERARPGEMWQSDITSLVLRREGRRVYLTVFMDDHGREPGVRRQDQEVREAPCGERPRRRGVRGQEARADPRARRQPLGRPSRGLPVGADSPSAGGHDHRRGTQADQAVHRLSQDLPRP